MTPFFILSGPSGSPESTAIAVRLRDALIELRPQWTVLFDEPDGLVAVKGDGCVLTGRVEGRPTFVIGDLFPTGAGFAEGLLSSTYTFREVCALLAAHCWGAYFVVQLHRDGGISIFRDPIGMRDGISWSRDRLRLVASDPLPWLSLAPPEGLAIDWRRLAELLHSSASIAEAPPLAGIETISPGTVTQFENAERRSLRLWSPRHIYAAGGDAAGRRAELKRITTECVESWIAAYPNNMLELSGGFDSAVVAATGRRFGHALNFHAADFAADERRFARDIAQRHGIALDEIFMPVGSLGEADLAGMPAGVRPGIGSTTLFHDRPLTDFAASHAVDALFTGHGGDAVFFQHPTAMIASDPTFPRSNPAAYLNLARWCQTSAWDVARQAFGLASGLPHQALDSAMTQLPLTSGVPRSNLEWAGDLEDIPPAKRAQIHAIGSDRSAFGPSWRSNAMTVVHPLLSQPLVEYAIATDAYLLTKGKRDRALAREAFDDLLPASISTRKGKGSFSHFFGRSLATSTPFLRSYLLEGLLVRHGVLDRPRLEAMLDRDYLMRFDCYAKLLSAVIVEHWARVWSDRLNDAGGTAVTSGR